MHCAVVQPSVQHYSCYMAWKTKVHTWCRYCHLCIRAPTWREKWWLQGIFDPPSYQCKFNCGQNIQEHMLLNRVRSHLDDKLRPNQCGFREKRSTTEQILALRKIIEGIEDKNLSAVVTFIDFKKAFDTIHRGKMTKILKAYNIPDIIVHTIEDTSKALKQK